MRKILIIVFTFLTVIYSLATPSKSFANECSITTSPAKVTTNERTITINFNVKGLAPNEDRYWMKLGGVVVRKYDGRSNPTLAMRVDNSGNGKVENINQQGLVNPPDSNQGKFAKKTYKVIIQEAKPDGAVFCETGFTVDEATSSDPNPGGATPECTVAFNKDGTTVTELTSGDRIKFKVEGLVTEGGPVRPADTRRVVLKRGNINGPKIFDKCYLAGLLQNPGEDLGTWEDGQYYIEIRDACRIGGIGEQRACFNTVTIGNASESEFQEPTPPAPPCKGGSTAITSSGCKSTDTAFGEFATDPQGFVMRVFTLILSVSGGIAVLVFIMAGYKYMTSQGNPEAVKGAQEMLVSAITGLLFIIFSFVILRFIGIDLLRLPGLT